MKKIISHILSISFVLLAVSVIACGCSKTPNYKKYRTELNRIDTVTVDGTELTAYFFLLKEGNAVLDVCNSEGEVLQSFEFPADGNEYYTSLDFSFAFKEAKFQDMNFDSHLDLYLPLSVTTPNLEGMAWLWDTESKTFVLSKELSKLYELTVFPEKKIITSCDYSSPDGITRSEYKWEDGKLVSVSEYTVTN